MTMTMKEMVSKLESEYDITTGDAWDWIREAVDYTDCQATPEALYEAIVDMRLQSGQDDKRVIALRRMPVVGNAHDDRDCWNLAHEVVADSTLSMQNRLSALKKINELTGENDPVDERALADYLEYVNTGTDETYQEYCDDCDAGINDLA